MINHSLILPVIRDSSYALAAVMIVVSLFAGPGHYITNGAS
jgi:hypothetical protein